MHAQSASPQQPTRTTSHTPIDRQSLNLARHIGIGQNRLGANRLDLASEATVALLECGQRFDPSRGTRLTTYAFARIRGRARDAMRAEARFVRARDEGLLAPTSGPDLSLSERLDVWRTVERVAQELPTVERTVLDGLYRRDQPLREVADGTRWSEDQLQRAHQKLLERLRSAARPNPSMQRRWPAMLAAVSRNVDRTDGR